MTNEINEATAAQPPARQRARAARGAHSRQAQMSAQLSQSLPVLEVDDIPQQTGTPVITFDNVKKAYISNCMQIEPVTTFFKATNSEIKEGGTNLISGK